MKHKALASREISTRLANCLAVIMALPALAAAAIGNPGSPGPYTVTDLGVGQATDINNFGQVVGFGEAAGSTNNQAFLWTPSVANGTSGVRIDLGHFPSFLPDAEAYGINNLGQVVGGSSTNAAEHAFVWSPNSPNGTTGSHIPKSQMARHR